MSTVYNLEPPTKGKVCLSTSLGDIEVELWPKEAPLACRNFVQLCLEGYYMKTTFHRIIPKFMVQAGDETGTGKGGVSVYGSYFKDEFHSRLRFTHRGLVACANQNEPNTNNSQFFITLDRCEDLDRRYTIFGKVAGDTIFNVLRIAEIPTDSLNRPSERVSITATEVLWNPFDDIVPRTAPSEPQAVEETVPTKGRQKAVKNLALLSFGEDEEIEEMETAPTKSKMKSAHDVLQDEKLVQEDEESRRKREEMEEKLRRERLSSVRNALRHKDPTAETSASMPKPSMDEKLRQRIEADKMKNKVEEVEVVLEESEEPEVEREKMGYDRLYIKRKKTVDTEEDTSLMDESERTRSRIKQRKKIYGEREKETLEKLNMFQQSLKSQKKREPVPEKTAEPVVNVELPAAWRVGDYLKDVETIGVTELLSHRLEFDHAKKDAMSRDMHALDDYIVVDTRLEKQGQMPDVETDKWSGRPNV